MLGHEEEKPRASPVVNPLTGRKGLWFQILPPDATIKELAETIRGRPLPAIDLIEAEDCNLCRSYALENGRGQTLLTRTVTPMLESHLMMILGRHTQDPGELSALEWEEFLRSGLGRIHELTDPVLYANLGVRSGASQPHVHAHIMEEPGGTNEYGAHGDNCVLCSGICKPLLTEGSWVMAHLPGGLDGEIVIHAAEHHTKVNDSFKEACRLLAYAWEGFALIGISSGQLALHMNGHMHLHLAPSVSAYGALEGLLGKGISRLSYSHLLTIMSSVRRQA